MRQPQKSRVSRFLKRAIDVCGAGLLLVLLAPALFLMIFLIKLQDGGPVIFRRRVVGPRGPFEAYKFRSMRTDADAILAANPQLEEGFKKNYKLKSDPRVTRVGTFLRKYSLDELPQLINVIKGEMSLVGPRMITAPELLKYGPHRGLLLTVKPGLTGYWQISGRQNLDYEERVRLDLHYVQNWSLKMDLFILAKTPAKVFKGEGAY